MEVISLNEINKRLANIESKLATSKEVWTLDDFANYSGIAKSYLYKLIMQRKLPVYKPNGKAIFLNREEAINWLLQNKLKTAEEQDIAAATHVTLNHSGLLKRRRA